MKYTYETYKNADGTRIDTCTRFEDLENRVEENKSFFNEFTVHILRTADDKFMDVLTSINDLEGWRVRLEREEAWKPKVNLSPAKELPSHAKHQFVDDSGFHDITLKDGESLQFTSKICDDVHTIENIKKVSIKEKDNINPLHYQGFLEISKSEILRDQYEGEVLYGLQWLETMCRIERYRTRPDEFIAAIELQVRKYLDRKGRKDEDLQELEKGLWYYKFMVAYIKNGKQPIFVRDIEEILARK